MIMGKRIIPRNDKLLDRRNPGVNDPVASYRCPTEVGPTKDAMANTNMLTPRGEVMSSVKTLNTRMMLVS